jgi:lysophospholipase L1-like esterase
LLPQGIDDKQRALVRGGISHWNHLIADRVKPYGQRVTLVDLFAVSEQMMSQRSNVAPDGFHLSTAGHKALAELVWDHVNKEGYE